MRDDALQAERAHLRAGAAARVDRLRPAHDAAGQHAVLARARDVDHRQVARPLAAGVARDRVAHVDVVHARVRRAVLERRPRLHGSSPSSTPPPCRRGRCDRNRSCGGTTGSSRRRWQSSSTPDSGDHDVQLPRAALARGRSTGPSRRSAGCPDPAATAFRRAAGRGVHVGAAAAEQRAGDAHRRVRGEGLTALEIDEQRRALRRELRIARHLAQELRTRSRMPINTSITRVVTGCSMTGDRCAPGMRTWSSMRSVTARAMRIHHAAPRDTDSSPAIARPATFAARARPRSAATA